MFTNHHACAEKKQSCSPTTMPAHKRIRRPLSTTAPVHKINPPAPLRHGADPQTPLGHTQREPWAEALTGKKKTSRQKNITVYLFFRIAFCLEACIFYRNSNLTTLGMPAKSSQNYMWHALARHFPELTTRVPNSQQCPKHLRGTGL